MPRGLAFGEGYPEDFMEITCQPPSKELRQSGWQGSRDGYHPIVFSFAPIFWEDDFKGEGRCTDDGVNYRWLFFLKYPDGVSVDEGDTWFKEVFAPEVCANPEVNRMISSRQLDDPRINPFHRVVGGLVRRLEGLAQGHRREGRTVHQAGLGHLGRGALLRALQGLRGRLHPRPARLRPPAAMAGVHHHQVGASRPPRAGGFQSTCEGSGTGVSGPLCLRGSHSQSKV